MTKTGDDRTRTALAVTLVTALVACLLAFFFPSPTAWAMTPDTGFEKCLRDKHNAARQAAGLAPLETRSEMVTFARNHTAAMINAGKIFHSGNLGSATSGWTKLGENVGVGGGCDSLHNAFMNSAGHKANILDSVYTSIGVGGGVSPDGKYFVTVVFAAHKEAAPTTTTTTTPPAPTTPAPKKTPTTAAPKPTTTTTAAPTTTTTAPPLEIPNVQWDSLVTDLIRIALESFLPVRMVAPGSGIQPDQSPVTWATS